MSIRCHVIETIMACLLISNRSDHESERVGFGVGWIQSQDSESEYVVYLGSGIGVRITVNPIHAFT